MRRLTQPKDGLFPQPQEIDMDCSCPDWAVLCKHVAAVLYGVAARLDADPQLLFTLRGVDHAELISQAVAAENLERSLSAGKTNVLSESNLEEVFGIEIDRGHQPAEPVARKQPSTRRVAKPAVAPKSTEGLPARSRTKKAKPLTKNATLKAQKKTLPRKPARRRRKARQPA
jgi:uncharacterized Zn finger protein